MSITEIGPARAGDVDAVLGLVGAVGLPQDGVRQVLSTLLVARAAGEVVGCAAIEIYGRDGLLRSVAVAADRRGSGLGRRLTDAALMLAAERRLDRLYLLTETATTFFARLGFEPVSRVDVPAAVQASPEFSHLCPASAQAMMRDLRPSGGHT